MQLKEKRSSGSVKGRRSLKYQSKWIAGNPNYWEAEREHSLLSKWITVDKKLGHAWWGSLVWAKAENNTDKEGRYPTLVDGARLAKPFLHFWSKMYVRQPNERGMVLPLEEELKVGKFSCRGASIHCSFYRYAETTHQLNKLSKGKVNIKGGWSSSSPTPKRCNLPNNIYITNAG